MCLVKLTFKCNFNDCSIIIQLIALYSLYNFNLVLFIISIIYYYYIYIFILLVPEYYVPL